MDFKSQVLVFSHIPKNAGASVLLALHNALGGARSISLRMQKIEIIRNGGGPDASQSTFPWCVSPSTGFVSYFNYRKDQLPQLMNGRADHPLLDATGTIPATPMEFLDMLIRRRTRDWRNAQVRYFSSAGTFSGVRRCNVEKRVITAPMTQLQGFAKLIEREIGTQPLVISHENRGLSRAKASESQLSASDADQIRLYFEEDCRLYEFVRDKLPCIGNAGLRMPA